MAAEAATSASNASARSARRDGSCRQKRTITAGRLTLHGSFVIARHTIPFSQAKEPVLVQASPERALSYPSLSTELRFIADCCRLSFDARVLERVQQRAATVDWRKGRSLAARHRVEGLVWHAIKATGTTPPGPVGQSLADDARSIADNGLRVMLASARLVSAFDQAGIALLFVKGLTLGQLAYANPFVKMGCDVDVLVPPDRVSDAAVTLRDLDFRLLVPASASSLQRWHPERKESVWQREADGIVVELHTRLADNSLLIPAIDTDSPRQEVAIGTTKLPTLARDELFAYLCVHGASSAWFRLKWVSDLAGLLKDCGPDEIERLYRRALALGTGRSAGQALLLLELLFETELGPALSREIKSDRATRSLLRTALRMLRGDEPARRRLGTLPIHLSQFSVERGLAFKWAELKQQVRAAQLNRALA